MSEYLNATCHVCGKAYHKCEYCDKVKEYTPWRSIACSIDCYKIFMAINRYTKKDITKEDAREILERYDFSNMEGYSQSVQRAVKEIMTVEDDERFIIDEPKETKPKKQNKKMRYKSNYYKSLSNKKESEDDNE